MEFKVEKLDDVAVLKVPVDVLDANNSHEFSQDIEPLLTSFKKVALDLSPLTFIDSTGLAAILSCLTKLSEAGGGLRLFGMKNQVRSLFEVVRMQWIFEMCKDKDEAVSTLKDINQGHDMINE
jgi:anti-sigma B factor antagonist